jgi:hypothetical protein
MAGGVARIAFAIFAGALIMAPVASKAQNAVDFPLDTAPEKPATDNKTADDCLTAPSGEALQGQRWFYRTERGTQRHCWYLRDKAEQRASQPAPAMAITTAAKPIAIAPRAAMPPRPNADARAELPARSRLDGDNTLASRAQSAASPVTSDGAPQPLDSYSAPPPAADSPVADASDAVGETNANLGMSAVTPDAGLRSDAAPPKTSLQRLLVAIFGALAFAGVTASLIHRFAFIWRKRNARLRRRTLWQSAKKARTRPPQTASAPAASAPAASVPAASAQNVAANQVRADAPNRQDDDAQGQIEELLGRVAQRVKHEAVAPTLVKLVNSQAAAAGHGRRSSAPRGARA